MDLRLEEHEVELMRDLLSDDLDRLIHEIARTDSRAARKELKRGEAVLEGILEKLGGRVVRKAS